MALIGLSGTGKSSLAPLLAQRTGRAAVDLDAEVESAAGVDVQTLFADEGEVGFRRRELAALREVLSGPPAVIATGGGVVTTPEAAELLSRRTAAVYLFAEPRMLVGRLGTDHAKRPLLRTDPLAGLTEMADRRDPLYRSVADITIDIGSDPLDALAERIERVLQESSP